MSVAPGAHARSGSDITAHVATQPEPSRQAQDLAVPDTGQSTGEFRLNMQLAIPGDSSLTIGLGVVTQASTVYLMPEIRQDWIETTADHRIALGNRLQLTQQFALMTGFGDTLMRVTMGISTQLGRHWSIQGAYTTLGSVSGSGFEDRQFQVAVALAM